MSRNFNAALAGLKDTYPSPDPARQDEFLRSLPVQKEEKKRAVLPLFHISGKPVWYAVPAALTAIVMLTAGISVYRRNPPHAVPSQFVETTTVSASESGTTYTETVTEVMQHTEAPSSSAGIPSLFPSETTSASSAAAENRLTIPAGNPVMPHTTAAQPASPLSPAQTSAARTDPPEQTHPASPDNADSAVFYTTSRTGTNSGTAEIPQNSTAAPTSASARSTTPAVSTETASPPTWTTARSSTTLRTQTAQTTRSTVQTTRSTAQTTRSTVQTTAAPVEEVTANVATTRFPYTTHTTNAQTMPEEPSTQVTRRTTAATTEATFWCTECTVLPTEETIAAEENTIPFEETPPAEESAETEQMDSPAADTPGIDISYPYTPAALSVVYPLQASVLEWSDFLNGDETSEPATTTWWKQAADNAAEIVSGTVSRIRYTEIGKLPYTAIDLDVTHVYQGSCTGGTLTVLEPGGYLPLSVLRLQFDWAAERTAEMSPDAIRTTSVHMPVTRMPVPDPGTECLVFLRPSDTIPGAYFYSASPEISRLMLFRQGTTYCTYDNSAFLSVYDLLPYQK